MVPGLNLEYTDNSFTGKVPSHSHHSTAMAEILGILGERDPWMQGAESQTVSHHAASGWSVVRDNLGRLLSISPF